MLHCNGYISFGNPFDDEPSEHCALPSQFNWTSSPALIGPNQSNWASVKDPTIVQYNGLSHIYATVFDTALNSRSEEHTSELQSRGHLVCRLLLEKKKKKLKNQLKKTE